MSDEFSSFGLGEVATELKWSHLLKGMGVEPTVEELEKLRLKLVGRPGAENALALLDIEIEIASNAPAD